MNTVNDYGLRYVCMYMVYFTVYLPYATYRGYAGDVPELHEIDNPSILPHYE